MGSGEEHECPTCGDVFDTETGCSIHHNRVHGESIAGADVECAYCGSTKRVDKDVARNNDRHFCDLECKSNWQSEEWSGENHPCHERETVTCEWCGEDFDVEPYLAEKRRFCSEECSLESLSAENTGSNNHFWNGGKVDVRCEQCDRVYAVDPCDADDTSFCSKECHWEWISDNWIGENSPNWKGGKVTLECAHCGDTFEALQATAGERRFCSKSCTRAALPEILPSGEDHPRWKGGDARYGEGWTEVKRRKVRIRDQARCQHCGRTEAEHIRRFGAKHTVHHIIPARSIDDAKKRNAMENLITLCRGECHRTWEKMAPLRPITSGAEVSG